MKTRKQIAEEIHDKLLAELVLLNSKVSVLRLEGKEKEKEKTMIERDHLDTQIKLLEKEENI